MNTYEESVINANSEEEIWRKVEDDIKDQPIALQYYRTIYHNGKKIFLAIDIDPGGGFEGGYEITSISSIIPFAFTSLNATVDNEKAFRFALHHKDFLDRIGKFFGMEDVVIGYPEFDEELIVKTNNADKVKAIFADKNLREYFQSLRNFSLHITETDDKDEKKNLLELEFDRGITDVAELKKMYDAFCMVLKYLL